MYNKKEWVNDEIITKEALNNIENGIADLDAKMNDVVTKKELQTIENDIAENNNELNDLKEGLVASLVAQGHKVDKNSDWKDLFDILLSGSGSVPDVPTPDVPEDDKGCTSIRFTESSLKIHIEQVTDLKEILIIEPEGCVDPVEWVADNTILEINNGVIKGLAIGSTKVQARCGGLSANINITVEPKMSEDEPIEIIDDEITIQVGERYDATKLYTLQKGYNVQYKYSSIIAIEGDHTIVGKEVGTTELEIVCGEIIKTVTIHVVLNQTPYRT